MSFDNYSRSLTDFGESAGCIGRAESASSVSAYHHTCPPLQTVPENPARTPAITRSRPCASPGVTLARLPSADLGGSALSGGELRVRRRVAVARATAPGSRGRAFLLNKPNAPSDKHAKV